MHGLRCNQATLRTCTQGACMQAGPWRVLVLPQAGPLTCRRQHAGAGQRLCSRALCSTVLQGRNPCINVSRRPAYLMASEESVRIPYLVDAGARLHYFELAVWCLACRSHSCRTCSYASRPIQPAVALHQPTMMQVQPTMPLPQHSSSWPIKQLP